jgi:lysozyme
MREDEVLKEAAKFVAQFEGFSATPYLDAAGVPTIGYGTTRGVKMSMGAITEDKAREYLMFDLSDANKTINNLVKPLINKNQKIALLSFVYNVGAGNFKSSTLLRRINAKKWDEAAWQFKKWVYAGGKVLKGLIRRREAESALFLKPVTENDNGTA